MAKAYETVWDKQVPGLGIRKNKRGSSSWVFKYRHSGRQVWVTLGPADLLAAPEARAQAKKIRWEAKQGHTPMPSPRAESITVETLVKRFLDFCDEHMQLKSTEKYRSLARNHIIPMLGNRKVKDIRKSDIRKIHAQVGQKHRRAANMILEMVSSMWNRAIKQDWIPATAINPALGIERFPAVKRERWLTIDEMNRLAQALNTLEPFERAYFWLLILTGCRKSELAQLKWSQVDLENGSFYIRETKNGTPHWSPLAPQAVALLKALPRVNDFVFPGRKKNDHWQRPDKAWLRVRKSAGLDDVKLHDLRHTHGSWLAQQGNDLKLVGLSLNHRALQSTNRYVHFAKEALRTPLEQLASSLPIEPSSPPNSPPSVVIPFAKRTRTAAVTKEE